MAVQYLNTTVTKCLIQTKKKNANQVIFSKNTKPKTCLYSFDPEQHIASARGIYDTQLGYKQEIR